MELPQFKYHPDPLATGSIEASDDACDCCGQARGFLYASPIYCEPDVVGLCPWCIADGTAHEKFAASFTDEHCLEGLPAEVIDAIAHRTPAFSTWQQGQWWSHCGDGGAFLGAAEQVTLSEVQVEELIEALRDKPYGLTVEGWRKYFQAPGDSGLTAYVFRCLHCNRTGGYWDSD